MYILNGRVGSEPCGQYTCRTARGSSVVDYIIVGADILPYVSNFCVHTITPLSDHNSISVNLSFTNKSMSDTINSRYANTCTYKWNDNKKELYTNNINSEYVTNQLLCLSEMIQGSCNTDLLESSVEHLSAIILGAAEPCKVKVNKNTKQRNIDGSPWYDAECTTKRKVYSTLRNEYNRTNEQPTKIKRDEARSSYRTMCKSKCDAYDAKQTLKLYQDKHTDPKSFWKQIKGPKQKSQREYVSLPLFMEHFSSLSKSRCTQGVDGTHLYFNYVPVLDEAFSVHEIDAAIKHLKNGKASGDDNIRSEFLSCAKDKIKVVIANLFNKLYGSAYFPEQWSTGVIVPIHKKGNKSDPGNYRGITLTSSMSKLLTYALNQRLLKWSAQCNVSSQSQFAYKPGYSTTDAIYVLHSALAQTMTHSKVFCAFIDFSKAFDRIERNILYQKLIRCGISSKMLYMIKNMYSKIKSRVKTTEGSTDTFPLESGVMQGECLSPSLFSLYINDIVMCIDNTDGMGVVLSGTKVSVLKYADDLVLLSTSASGLQHGLNELRDFCNVNMLTVNTEKSKVMCFARKRPSTIQTLYYDDNILERVDDFKYLGVTFSKTNTFTNGIEVLCQQARRAKTVVDLHTLKHKTLSVKHILDLFDTLVKPILLYGCEVYGANCNYKALETFHLCFLKSSLNVKQSTNSCMVYAETGRFPLSIDVNVNMVKFWLKIISSPTNRLIWITYSSMINGTVHTNKVNCWTRQIKQLLCTTGFGYVWEEQAVYNEKLFLKLFEVRCKDMFRQKCLSEIESSNRCRLYANIKCSHEMEPYLLHNYRRDIRSNLTKIRLSSHKFLVERGRWQKPKMEYTQRICTLCDSSDIEDEYHILMTCSHYIELRHKYIKQYYYRRPSMLKFKYLLNTTNKRDRFRLMVYIKLVVKDYNSRLTRD